MTVIWCAETNYGICFGKIDINQECRDVKELLTFLLKEAGHNKIISLEVMELNDNERMQAKAFNQGKQ